VDRRACAGSARPWPAGVAPARRLAVVKADAYGHGAVPVAREAVRAGATWLGVALVEEALGRPVGLALRIADEVVGRGDGAPAKGEKVL